MRVKSCLSIVLAGALAGCAALSEPLSPLPLVGGNSKGLFGGTHIRYDSTVEPGKLYRTASPGRLEFGSQLKPHCESDFAFIQIKTSPHENKQDYKDELSGKISASASGIEWVSALFSLSGGAEVAVTADFKAIYSEDAINLPEIDGKLGTKCVALISKWKKQCYTVFLVERAYQTDDTVTLTAMSKANASASVGNLKFVQVGPSGSMEGARTQTRTFRGTVVEVSPYVKE